MNNCSEAVIRRKLIHLQRKMADFDSHKETSLTTVL